MDLNIENLYKRFKNDPEFANKIIEIQSNIFEKLKTVDNEQYENFLLIQKIRFSLNNESDRGCVLLAVSYLEDALGKYILSYLKGSNTFKKKMLRYNLSNFSSRINFAYSIGLINDKLLNDLDVIREIRNEFAHSFEPIDLNSENIDGLIKKLHYKFRNENGISNRQQLTTYIFSLLGVILPYHDKILDIKNPVDIEQSFISIQNFIKDQINGM